MRLSVAANSFALTALTLAALGSPASASEPLKKPAFGFSTLKSTPAQDAKAKSEAWLKSVGKFDAAAFNKIWADESRTVLDRTVDSLVLGSPEAGALLADIRQPEGTPPAIAPAILLDVKKDVFFRSNVSLAFAKAAAARKVYEEALDALNAATPEASVDPSMLYFYKAVCEFSTMRKDAASISVLRLIDDVADAPDRYKRIAIEMFFEMQHWSPDPKDLSNIERLMDNSGRRLELARGGDKTQNIQKKIVFRLDELIKEMENREKNGPGSPGPGNDGNCPPGGQQGKNPGNTTNPNQHADDSKIMGGSGAGNVDEKKLRQIAEEWGSLPPEKRAKIVDEITRDTPQKFKPLIDEYFKSLNRVHGYNK